MRLTRTNLLLASALLTCIPTSVIEAGASASARGLVRFQRGDQGPDDDIAHPGFITENPSSISIIEENSSSETIDFVAPPIGGPNVCRSRARTFCCPGWNQRGTTGLCVEPVCGSNRCGLGGRCIKPNLCLCEGGTIASRQVILFHNFLIFTAIKWQFSVKTTPLSSRTAFGGQAALVKVAVVAEASDLKVVTADQ